MYRGRSQLKNQKKSLQFSLPQVPDLDLYKNIKIRDDRGNSICIKKEDGSFQIAPSISGLQVQFKGGNNTVIIEEGTKFVNCFVKSTDNSIVIIRKGNFVNSLIIDSWGSGNCCYIAENFSCIGAVITMHEGKTVFIDRDCQFSYDISIWTTDGHAILKDGQCVNHGKDVYIGRHVWIGHRVEILKGSYIAENSVIGAFSLVNRKFIDKNIVIAGVPARIKQRNISWDRRNPVNFSS